MRNEIVLKLYRQDPHCYWCGRKTALKVRKIKQVGSHTRKLDFHPDTATIDHLISNGHDVRKKSQIFDKKYVLSCYGCNQARAIKETLERSLLKSYCLSGISWWKVISLIWNKIKENGLKKTNQ